MERIGKLTILEVKKEISGDRNRLFAYCICSCGKKHRTRLDGILHGTTKSCGCYNIEKAIKHEQARTRTYKSWQAMKQRCTNENSPNYHNYGGRGINYCLRWEIFANFYEDMGDRPLMTTLDRIDVNGNYEPSNCRWADYHTQSINKRK